MISFSLVSLKKEETLLKKKQKYSHYLPEKLVVTKEHLSSTGEWLVELPESTSQTSTSVSASVKKNIEINMYCIVYQYLYGSNTYHCASFLVHYLLMQYTVCIQKPNNC